MNHVKALIIILFFVLKGYGVSHIICESTCSRNKSLNGLLGFRNDIKKYIRLTGATFVVC